MGNCLKTQLNAAVQNDNLELFGKFSFSLLVPSSKRVKVGRVNKSGVVVTLLNGTINSVEQGIMIDSTHIEFVPNQLVIFTINEDISNLDVIISDKYSITYLTEDCPITHIVGGIDSMMYIDTLKGFEMIINNDKTDINKFQNAKFNETLELMILYPNQPQNLVGSVDSFAGFTKLIYVNMYGASSVTGDIESFVNCTAITTLNLPYTDISGDGNAFLNALAASGRTDNLTFGVPTKVSFTDKHLNDPSHTIRFNSGMVNPTEAESARGWQVV